MHLSLQELFTNDTTCCVEFELEPFGFFHKVLYCFKHYLSVERECYYRRADYTVLLHNNVRRFATKLSSCYSRTDNLERNVLQFQYCCNDREESQLCFSSINHNLEHYN